MRQVVRDYVLAVHATYLDHVRHLPPGDRATLPLVEAADLTVVAAAGRRLHLVATTDHLPAPRGPEVALHDEYAGSGWTLRFYDPSVLPDLGILDRDDPHEVRRALGIADAVYHLTVDVGGGLDGHHASHSGVALANQHASVLRDVTRLRRARPREAALVDELAVAVRLGLDEAARLLVAELTLGRVAPPRGASAHDCLVAALGDLP